MTLNGAGEPVTVNTKGKSWWITTIEIDGKIIYHLTDSSENWNMPQTGKFYQKCDWLNVKADDWTLNISARHELRREQDIQNMPFSRRLL